MRRMLAVLFVLLAGSPARAQEGAWVPFDSADGTPIRGWLALPAGEGPHPGVVMLHGCSGPVAVSGKMASRERAWIDILTGAGYAVLLADSFTTRGFGSICALTERPVGTDRERPWDAVGALAFLKAQPGVDASRIALMGWSHGGSTTLWTIRAGTQVESALGGADFRAAVAFYPGCSGMTRLVPPWRPRMPFLIQMGLADDWTRPGPCRDLAARAVAGGAAVEADFYEGAHHAFDSPNSKVRTRIARSSDYKDGEKEVHVGTHAEARAAAIARTLAWLADHLR